MILLKRFRIKTGATLLRFPRQQHRSVSTCHRFRIQHPLSDCILCPILIALQLFDHPFGVFQIHNPVDQLFIRFDRLTCNRLIHLLHKISSHVSPRRVGDHPTIKRMTNPFRLQHQFLNHVLVDRHLHNHKVLPAIKNREPNICACHKVLNVALHHPRQRQIACIADRVCACHFAFHDRCKIVGSTVKGGCEPVFAEHLCRCCERQAKFFCCVSDQRILKDDTLQHCFRWWCFFRFAQLRNTQVSKAGVFRYAHERTCLARTERDVAVFVTVTHQQPVD